MHYNHVFPNPYMPICIDGTTNDQWKFDVSIDFHVKAAIFFSFPEQLSFFEIQVLVTPVTIFAMQHTEK